MIKRLLGALGVLALLGAALLAAGAGGDKDSGTDYWVELDNAFGLIEGADVKVGGVRAGKITEMDIEERNMRALVGIDINKPGFETLHEDAFCETRPQSLIGEYFVDCQTGGKRPALERGAKLPVTRTASTIPVDLVNSIMQRPYRERFSILLSELGIALAARGEDLNATIRRAVPALRETNQVLAKLARQRRTIRDLNDNADKVLKSLADAREDVGRFVVEAADTSEISASRARQLRAQFQQLPGFLRELQPTMRSLGSAARDQTPALRTLAAQSSNLQRFFGALGDFSEASRPSTRALAAAARKGRPTVKAARPQVRRLGRVAKPLPEIATNAAITLEALDDPKRAVEKDPRSPRGGSGYTGFEAILRYVWGQTQATNIFDAEGHLLKISALVTLPCALYADAEAAKGADHDKCAAILGPNRPGINQPDPSKTTPPARAKRSKGKREAVTEAPKLPELPAATTPAATETPAAPKTPTATVQEALKDILDTLRPIIGGNGKPPLGGLLPGNGRDSGSSTQSAKALLDYLLGGESGR
jgi:phospholipid/cholesterol/gamma-HCH transport system substrate-binding protein